VKRVTLSFVSYTLPIGKHHADIPITHSQPFHSRRRHWPP